MRAATPPEDVAEPTRRPSKTRRKKDMHALQGLGERLVALSPQRLARLTLPDDLREAVLEARRITSHEARRRQLQYIGKLMRKLDAAPIQAQLDTLDGTSRAETARQHRLEALRTRLLVDPGTLEHIAARWPGADIEALGRLRREALEEDARGRPPAARRALFRALRALDEDDAGAEEVAPE